MSIPVSVSVRSQQADRSTQNIRSLYCMQ